MIAAYVFVSYRQPLFGGHQTGGVQVFTCCFVPSICGPCYLGACDTLAASIRWHSSKLFSDVDADPVITVLMIQPLLDDMNQTLPGLVLDLSPIRLLLKLLKRLSNPKSDGFRKLSSAAFEAVTSSSEAPRAIMASMCLWTIGRSNSASSSGWKIRGTTLGVITSKSRRALPTRLP